MKYLKLLSLLSICIVFTVCQSAPVQKDTITTASQEIFLKQHKTKAIKQTNSRCFIKIGELKGGEVPVTVDEGTKIHIDSSMEAGEYKSFKYNGEKFYVFLKEYHNFKVGQDYCLFQVSSSKPSGAEVSAAKKKYNSQYKN